MKKLRLCKINGKKAYFHRWCDKSEIFPPSPMVGGHRGGEVKRTVGLIEYLEDGTVHECHPNEIRFIESEESDAN